MKPVTLFICLLLFSFSAFAQTTGTISGQVKDIRNEPLAASTIRLLNAGDSTIVQVKLTRENGRFELTSIAQGKFILSVAAIGYKTYYSNLLMIDASHPLIILPYIILQPDKATELKEVTVVSKKPLIENDIDKTVVNVEAMVGSAVMNSLEMLERTPGVTITAQGEISLNGRSGVLVLIEGRATFLSGNDLAAYLRSLPGGTIDKIELMSNPPAKYDASGSAVINIRLKRNKVNGYSGNISTRLMQGRTTRNYNSLSLNYLDRKLNLFGTVGINSDANRGVELRDRTFYKADHSVQSVTALQNILMYRINDVSGRIGMDYTISSKTVAGIILSASRRHNHDQTDYTNSEYVTGSTGITYGSGNQAGDALWRQLSANMNLQHKFNTRGKELSADINYVRYSNDAGQLFANRLQPVLGADSSYAFRYTSPSSVSIYSAQADYTHPFGKKLVLSGGIKASLVNNNLQSDYADIKNNTETPDPSKSNHFLYRENINAAYINARKEWKRVGVQLGLRLENTETKGNQLGNSAVAAMISVRSYTGLFPTLFFSYKLDSMGKNTLSFNYARRLQRPGYSQLNPFRRFIDQYSYQTGNPQLGPAYNQYMELNYRYKQFISISLQYDRVNHSFFEATGVENSLFVIKPENADTRYMLALFTNLNLNLAKWWRMNMNIGVANFVTKGNIYNQNIGQSIVSGRLNILNQFTFPGGWTAELRGNYTSRSISLQRRVEPKYLVSTGVQKKIWKQKGTVSFYFDDIFSSMIQREYITGLAQVDSYRTYRQDSRRVTIGLNINFGKETFMRKRRQTDNSADDVKGRVE